MLNIFNKLYNLNLLRYIVLILIRNIIYYFNLTISFIKINTRMLVI
jgi:hypothetical protein